MFLKYLKVQLLSKDVDDTILTVMKKNSGFNRIWTRDLCDTGAVLYQLSYKATSVESRWIDV